jgi:hypothetical protein
VRSWSRPKDPDDIRFLGFDWSPWLTGDRTSIVTSTFTVVEGTVTTDQASIAGGITKFRVQGGTAGEVCHIQNRVTFNNGESLDDTSRLRIRSN